MDDDLFLNELNKRISTSRLKVSNNAVLSVDNSFGA